MGSWFNNISFRIKLAIPFALLGVLMLIIALVGIRNTNVLNEGAAVISGEFLPGVNTLLQADRDLYQALVAERSMLFVNVGSDAYRALRQQHSENIQQAYDRLNAFGELTHTPNAKAMVADFNRLFAQWRATSEKIVSERSSGTPEGRSAATELSFGHAAQQFDAARNIIDELTVMVEADSAEQAEAIVAAADESVRLQLLSVAAGVLLSLAIAITFPALITRPIRHLLERIEDISHGEGDLTARVEVSGKDEIGQLGAAFNAFVEKLQGLIAEVTTTTRQVTSAADELSAYTSETSENVRQQHSATDQVATAVTEMSATVQEVARSAGSAAGATRDADSSAREGRQVVTDTIDAIEALARDVEQSSRVIVELEEKSENVGSVLDVIQGIAEQTNLLALNAAIEAARAGEQGRGFAVVADEVRTLASRTQESTSEIQAMIEALQQGARNAVQSMEAGRTRAQGTVEKASEAGTALQSITEAMSAINDMNNQIASAAEEQSAVTEDITRNVNGINTLSEGSATTAQQTEQASEELARLAEQLQRLVGQFRV